MNSPSLIPYTLRVRANRYCRAMERAIGVDPVKESRKREVVTARTFVAYRLLLEGFTEHAIGAVLGWDHSTINFYRRRAVTMLNAPGYDTEREIWKLFNEKI